MKKLSVILCSVVIVLLSALPAFAYDDSLLYLDDAGNTLSTSDADTLQSTLKAKSKELNFDIVIVTTSGMIDGYTMESYADDYYDYMGYSKDGGCLLLYNAGTNEMHLSTTGKGIDLITDDDRSYFSEEIRPDINSGNYNEGFTKFVSLVEDEVNGTKHFKIKFLLIGLGIGLAVGLIVIFIFKGQLKSVAKKTEANDYLRQGSFMLTGQNDRFITVHVSKSAKSSNSGSSTHTGSSGTSHGGGSM